MNAFKISEISDTFCVGESGGMADALDLGFSTSPARSVRTVTNVPI